MRFGAAGAVAAPFVAGLRVGVLAGEIARSEPPHPRCGEQKRVFDAGANSPQMLPQKALQKSLFELIRRRHEQPAQECIDIAPLQRAGDSGIVCDSHHRGIECAP